MPSYKTVIHWFRRDLRLTDNTALFRASDAAETVIPVYLLSDWKADHNWTGPARQEFLCGCLASLANDLKSIDSRLTLRDGGQVEAIRQLIKDTNADAIYFNRDPDPFGKAMEAKMRELAREIGIEIHDFKDVVLHEHDEIANLSDKPYKVYTPYSKNWFTHDKADASGRVRVLGKVPANLKSESVPTLSRWGLDSSGADLIPAGEKAAHDRLKTAFDGILQRYADDRNTPIGQTTSMLGADLRFGTISPRQVFHRAEKAIAETKSGSERESLHTFQKQLAWREFFMAILGHFPEVLETDFAEKWRGLKWDQPEDFPDKWEAWKTGKTGFPIVDAGMRQLVATGFMHNRVRMIVAMFLTKDLHFHWIHGESFFMQWLLDGEIANNNGGWQWSAGTGADAAPYFRIQNPWTQTARFDPQGEYVKKWVPELAKCDAKFFTKPPEGKSPIADDYVLPILQHKPEREETLARFKAHAGG